MNDHSAPNCIEVKEHGIYERIDGKIVGPVRKNTPNSSYLPFSVFGCGASEPYILFFDSAGNGSQPHHLIREIVVGEGWKPWNGGDKSPTISTSDVLRRCGTLHRAETPLLWDWRHTGAGPQDIVAYREVHAVEIKADPPSPSGHVEIKEHGIYERRDGKIVGPSELWGARGRFMISGGEAVLYDTNNGGSIFSDGQSSFDLIREIVVGEGWLPHNGSDSSPIEGCVEIITRDGFSSPPSAAKNWYWRHDSNRGDFGDIVAYREAQPSAADYRNPPSPHDRIAEMESQLKAKDAELKATAAELDVYKKLSEQRAARETISIAESRDWREFCRMVAKATRYNESHGL